MHASFLTSSSEAAERMKREKYHAVFLDMRMPAPDGAELARQIRASRVNASTVIVMITGEQDRTVMGRAFEAGVEFFLFKPASSSIGGCKRYHSVRVSCIKRSNSWRHSVKISGVLEPFALSSCVRLIPRAPKTVRCCHAIHEQCGDFVHLARVSAERTGV